MKLTCNGCGIVFKKPLKECIRYNRETKKGLCSICKDKEQEKTELILKEVIRDFIL